MLAEKGSELSHAIRRAETNERELRKFKLRIQESKKSESLKKVEGKKNKSIFKNEPKCCKTAQNEEIKGIKKNNENIMAKKERMGHYDSR